MPQDEITALIGNGQARVKMGFRVSDMNYGSGCSTWGEVELTVNQDDASLEQACEIASLTAVREVSLAHNRATDPEGGVIDLKGSQ